MTSAGPGVDAFGAGGAVGAPSPAHAAARDTARLGYWVAITTAVLGVVTAVVAVTTPPRSGPMCRLAVCVTYPYTDVAAYVPRDYLWLYPALALAVTFLLLVAVLVAAASSARRAQAVAAVSFSVLGVTLLIVDYGLQLFVVVPSLLAGEARGLTLLSQYNPHGVFIALENLGYATIAVGFVLLGLTLTGRDPLVRISRWVLFGGGVLTWVALAVMVVAYGADLEYRFELAAISVHWLVLVAVGLLMAVAFRRGARTDAARVP